MKKYLVVNEAGKQIEGTRKGRQIILGRYGKMYVQYCGWIANVRKVKRSEALRLFGIRRTTLQVNYLLPQGAAI
jgi:hypothetical protein